ncbi:hypothetical protein J1N35_002184 [Gossypium stocksii]|uniref:Uncharacterized protein n=1 Tax=Gossypium stocksii TaxID=47602 RepID=A0A9D3WM18_9ROSI|nr:hypothetical protein J1N35_002184 [Gossypium stocksii]
MEVKEVERRVIAKPITSTPTIAPVKKMKPTIAWQMEEWRLTAENRLEKHI